MTPDEYCEQRAGASGSSFYYSFLFLPAEQRRAIIALYAFCREVDDTVDECSDTGVARTKLAWWQQEIARMFAGNPGHPVTRALQPAIHSCNLEQSHFDEIIAGMEMDLDNTRYASFQELSVYCYRVASVVGLLSARIFGYRDPQTAEFARDLGTAFQLINILRDIGEDARRNRVYLPLDELDRFGVTREDILRGEETDGFTSLMVFQAERADRYYRQAMENLAEGDRLQQLPSIIMAEIYRANLNEIRADGFRVLKQKTTLPPLRKLWIAWRTRRREIRRAREHKIPA
jgi:phytoene synthase